MFMKFWFDSVALILLNFSSQVTSHKQLLPLSFFRLYLFPLGTHIHIPQPSASTPFIYFKVVKPFVVKDVLYP